MECELYCVECYSTTKGKVNVDGECSGCDRKYEWLFNEDTVRWSIRWFN
jgi:hypothetical protein